ncbi:hypothetical protein Tco_1074118 [Tanacetum coccineum]
MSVERRSDAGVMSAGVGCRQDGTLGGGPVVRARGAYMEEGESRRVVTRNIDCVGSLGVEMGGLRGGGGVIPLSDAEHYWSGSPGVWYPWGVGDLVGGEATNGCVGGERGVVGGEDIRVAVEEGATIAWCGKKWRRGMAVAGITFRMQAVCGNLVASCGGPGDLLG